MEIQIAPETRADLEAGIYMRFLYYAKFNLDSRHSEPVIAWAGGLAKAVSSAMLKDVGREASSVTPQMNMVELLRVRKYALICFDLGFEGYNNEQAQMKQPVHVITARGNTYYVRRNRRLEARVAQEFTTKQNIDKGPRPYFADGLHPPVYDEGRRVEGPVDRGEPEEGIDESETE